MANKPRKRPTHPDDLRSGFEYAVAHGPRNVNQVQEIHAHFQGLDIHDNELILVLYDGEDEYWVPWKSVKYIEHIG